MKKILFAVVATVLVCSCAKDNTTDNAKVEEQGVYYEFTATIDDLTRVEINDEKTKALWQVGDKVAVSDGSAKQDLYVTAVENGVATISGNLTIEPTMAYYPSWLWKADGTLNFPNPQTYSESVPVPMKGEIIDGAVTFSSKETGALVLAYPLKGDITITKAVLCAAGNQKVYSRNEVNNRRIYNLNINNGGLSLSADQTKYIYVVMQAENATKFPYITLDLTTTNVSTGALVSEYNLVRRKVSAISLDENNPACILEFPEMTLTAAELDENHPVWKFGSKYSTPDANGLVDGWGQITQADNTYGLGANKLCRLGTQSEEFITIDNAQEQGVQSKSETEAKLRMNFGRGAYQDHRKFKVHVGNYRYFAIKWSAPAMIATATNSSNASIKLDSDQGGFRNGGNKAKTGEIACTEENVVIWYYNISDEMKSNNYITTITPFEFKYFGFKVCDAIFPIADVTDAEGNIVAPTFDVYWAGFFNSVAEIEAFEAQSKQ